MARKNGNGNRTPRGMQAPYLKQGAKGTLKKKKMSLADRARKGVDEFGTLGLRMVLEFGGVPQYKSGSYAKKAIKAAKKAKGRGPLR
jgi:hypothetical protein